METLEAIRIDLADYEYAGEGANGVSYNHRHDPDVMLKLYRQGMVQQPLDEMNIARKVYEADFVTDGTRYGVRFRRIRDKVSYARAVGDHPENLVRYAEEFAQMCRQLHATHVDTTAFECVKDKYSRQLVENPFFSPAEKDRLLRFILDAPDTDTAIHGDLQYGNALFVGDERYFIDLGDFGYGYPLFDIGMVYATAYISEPDFVREAFHMEPATSPGSPETHPPSLTAYGENGRKETGICLPGHRDGHRRAGYTGGNLHDPVFLFAENDLQGGDPPG